MDRNHKKRRTHQDFADFRGTSQGELLCWLRTILILTLHRSFDKHLKVEKREVRREVSLESLNHRLEESACNLVGILPAGGPSPSAPMQARERAVALAGQLSKLKPQYREVIVLRVLQGLSFDEIAERMTFRPAHDGDDAPTILRMIDQQDVKPLRQHRPDLPRVLEKVIVNRSTRASRKAGRRRPLPCSRHRDPAKFDRTFQ